MKVKEFESKFSPEDIVWLMKNNKPSQAIVTRVKIEIQEEVYINGSEIPNILARIKNFLHQHKRTLSITYNIDTIQNGRFEAAQGGWFPESVLYATKEDLLKSL